jgi:large subunit ribosomal protein L4
MATIDVKSVTGEVIGTRDLPDGWFGAPVNVPLMHQVVVAGMAAQRSGTHATKTRAQVRGGGRKPWRQKGTGRARQGSIRSPQWTGGGVVHGPVPRDHSVRVNKKMRAAALRSALSDTLASGKLAVVEDVIFEEPHTKDALTLLSALELDGKVLFIIPSPDEVAEKSFRNLDAVKVGYPGNLSTYDLLNADRVLFTSGALDSLTGETASEDRAPAKAPRTPKAEKPKDDAPRPRNRAAEVAEADVEVAETDETEADETGTAAQAADAGPSESGEPAKPKRARTRRARAKAPAPETADDEAPTTDGEDGDER